MTDDWLIDWLIEKLVFLICLEGLVKLELVSFLKGGQLWETHWGFIKKRGLYPLCVVKRIGWRVCSAIIFISVWKILPLAVFHICNPSVQGDLGG